LELKRIDIITRPGNLEPVKEVLNRNQQFGMTVSMVSGCGMQKGRKEMYRGAEIKINLLPKIKIEAVVPDSMVDTLISEISAQLRTGEIGDGKIFVYDLKEVVKIRTGEMGDSAL
jgi:nitrogen regulatory protein PII